MTYFIATRADGKGSSHLFYSQPQHAWGWPMITSICGLIYRKVWVEGATGLAAIDLQARPQAHSWATPLPELARADAVDCKICRTKAIHDEVPNHYLGEGVPHLCPTCERPL